jgi:hypothetical protein
MFTLIGVLQNKKIYIFEADKNEMNRRIFLGGRNAFCKVKGLVNIIIIIPKNLELMK